MTKQESKSELITSNELGVKHDPMTTLVKMENETIASMAVARPRNMRAIMKELTEQLDAFPAFAESAVYRKPVGRDERGNMQFARGLSIRAAEALASSFGYCRVETSIEPIDETHVRVSATFTDFQSGKVWRDSGVLSKFYRNRAKQMVRHDDDRFYNLVCKAELSKRVREVIVRSVSPGLRIEFQAAAEKALSKVLTDETIAKIVASFRDLGVTLEMLEKFVGRSIAVGWNAEDRVALIETYNAIKDGETTVGEAFMAEAAKTASIESKPDEPAATSLADAVAKSKT